MSPAEVAAKLQHFNEWRRGDYEPSEQPDPPDPCEIGKAIDAAVEMIERLEVAESVLKGFGTTAQEVECWLERYRCLEREAEALRARIEEMERQNPACYEFQGRDGTWHPFIDQRHYENTVADGSWPIRTLYALPGAKGE